MVCKTTASDARTIYVSVNDEPATSFDSSLGTETVTSPDFAINEGDKISITIRWLSKGCGSKDGEKERLKYLDIMLSRTKLLRCGD